VCLFPLVWLLTFALRLFVDTVFVRLNLTFYFICWFVFITFTDFAFIAFIRCLRCVITLLFYLLPFVIITFTRFLVTFVYPLHCCVLCVALLR